MTTAQIALALDWGRLDQLVGDVADHIRQDSIPEAIVGIARGGMIPAVMLAHRLGVRVVHQVEARHTITDEPHAPKTRTPDVSCTANLDDCRGQDVLLVDDVVGSGATATAVAHLLAAPEPSRLRMATLVLNTVNWATANPDTRWSHSGFDYVGTTCAGWVTFPWEVR